MELIKSYEKCNICPRHCKAERTKGKPGVCEVTSELLVARAALHYWEEPCISGKNGSGTVFFSGCPLHCVYCQNEAISHGREGKRITKERLCEIFLELQEKGANNINLVTPTQYRDSILWAIEQAKKQGLVLPVVYNTSGYETVESLKMLEGKVDVYLTDFKYMDPNLGQRYSHAADYSKVAKLALEEMVRQQPRADFYPEEHRLDFPAYPGRSLEAEEGWLMERGVIVRVLLLPEALSDAKKIVRYLYETYGDRVFISLMSQYTPLSHVKNYPQLNRRITQREYDSLVDYAISLGISHGFLQENEVAEESFIPHFDCEGV